MVRPRWVGERGKAWMPEKVNKDAECRAQKRELYQCRPSEKQMPNRMKPARDLGEATHAHAARVSRGRLEITVLGWHLWEEKERKWGWGRKTQVAPEHRECRRLADGSPNHRFTRGGLPWAEAALFCHLLWPVVGWEHLVGTVALAPSLGGTQRCSIWRLSGRCSPCGGSFKGRSEQRIFLCCAESCL